MTTARACARPDCDRVLSVGQQRFCSVDCTRQASRKRSSVRATAQAAAEPTPSCLRGWLAVSGGIARINASRTREHRGNQTHQGTACGQSLTRAATIANNSSAHAPCHCRRHWPSCPSTPRSTSPQSTPRIHPVWPSPHRPDLPRRPATLRSLSGLSRRRPAHRNRGGAARQRPRALLAMDA
jgi:hypothetical protein